MKCGCGYADYRSTVAAVQQRRCVIRSQLQYPVTLAVVAVFVFVRRCDVVGKCNKW